MKYPISRLLLRMPTVAGFRSSSSASSRRRSVPPGDRRAAGAIDELSRRLKFGKLFFIRCVNCMVVAVTRFGFGKSCIAKGFTGDVSAL